MPGRIAEGGLWGKRLIRAVRDLSAETGARIETVALYTDADRTVTFVRAADVAYPLGPASARPYLDHAVLGRALAETRADAAWVGWGFVAEDPAFAELCEKLGVTFVGPSAEAMRQLGDKIGDPLMLKATAGGGERGIRMVASGADLVLAAEFDRVHSIQRGRGRLGGRDRRRRRATVTDHRGHRARPEALTVAAASA